MNRPSPIHSLFVFRFFRDFVLAMPVIVPFYLSHKVSPSGVFLLQSVFSMTLLLFEVPSGYFADVFGRKNSLLLGALMISLGWFVYAISSSLGLFALAEICLAIGFSLCSGTESALLYDILAESEKKEEYHVMEGRAEFYTRLGTAISAVLGGILATFFIRIPFFASMGCGLIMFCCALLIQEPRRSKPVCRNPFGEICSVARYGLSHAHIFPVILFSSAIMMTGIIGIWGYFFFLGKAGLGVVTNGVLFALFQICSAFGARHSGEIVLFLGERKSFGVLFVIPGIFLLLGMYPVPWMILLCLVHAFVWGFSTPFFLSLINRYVDSDYRATLLSVSSMVGRVSFVFLSPVFGYFIERENLGVAFIGLGGYLFMISSFSVIKLKKSMRRDIGRLLNDPGIL